MKDFLKKTYRNSILLFLEPRNFLYTFKIPNDKVVKIRPFDHNAYLAGEEVVRIISSKLPDLPILFVGSTRLSIPGINDIDLLAELSSQDREHIIQIITHLFGQPAKIKKTFVDWKFLWKGYEVELSIVDPQARLFKERIQIFRLLSDNPTLLDAYKKLKIELNGTSEREYQRQRLMFFTRALRNSL